jgi:hypothetical protein
MTSELFLPHGVDFEKNQTGVIAETKETGAQVNP